MGSESCNALTPARQANCLAYKIPRKKEESQRLPESVNHYKSRKCNLRLLEANQRPDLPQCPERMPKIRRVPSGYRKRTTNLESPTMRAAPLCKCRFTCKSALRPFFWWFQVWTHWRKGRSDQHPGLPGQSPAVSETLNNQPTDEEYRRPQCGGFGAVFAPKGPPTIYAGGWHSEASARTLRPRELEMFDSALPRPNGALRGPTAADGALVDKSGFIFPRLCS